MADKKTRTPKSGTFRATERGYRKGVIVEPGETFEATGFTGSWAEHLTKADARQARATEQALDPHPDDVNLTELKGDALTAYAATLNINRDGLNDKDLRAAVTAKRANDAG
jgi:hypothetical protein